MDYHQGLTTQKAHLILRQYGLNQLKEKSQVQPINIWLRQFTSPLVYILLLVIPVVIALGKITDALFIAFAVMFNTTLGFVQEYRNAKTLEALSNLINPTAKVKRDGEWQIVNSSTLVPGDLVRLEIGQSVPADGFLVFEDSIHLNEALLTGESVPVKKQSYKEKFNEDNISRVYEALHESYQCFAGSIVSRGIGEMVVAFTGSRTKMGHIALGVTQANSESTPLQKKLEELSKQLGLGVLITIVLVSLIGLARGMSVSMIAPVAIALAIAGIPEGLAISLTVNLTLGMKRILKRNALVTKMVAAETLGQVDVICLDKTGTLTEGQMIAQDGLSGKEDKKLLALGAILCNDFRDPLEIAMNDWAQKFLGTTTKKMQGLYPRVDEIPFDPKTKYIVTKHTQPDGNQLEFVSGAPEVILGLSLMDRKETESWLKQFKDLGTKGFRLVGFAYKIHKGKEIKNTDMVKADYKWLGVVTFIDPVREGVKETLRDARKAGINLKVITGDYKETAWSVLKEVGLVDGELDLKKVLTGEELKTLSGKDLGDRVEQAVLFARTNPEQKDLIVQILQNNNHVVGMMGDGVNDAPALKRADIGIVVKDASDVARETADLILLDNNFRTVLYAVEEGRAIFQSLRKVILYLLADAYSGVLLALGAIVFGWPLPLVASQVLLVTFIHDSFPYLALSMEPKEKGLLSQKPRPRTEALVSKKIFALMAMTALIGGFINLGVFGLGWVYFHFPLVLVRTMTLVTFSMCTSIYVFSARTLEKPLWSESLFANKWLIMSFVASLLLQMSVLYSPILQDLFGVVSLGTTQWMIVGVACVLMLTMVEAFKPLVFRVSRN